MRVHRVAAWICCAFAFVIAPATHAAPCHIFVDVQDTDPFCTHIAWMKNRGITLGCTANQYCPTLFVTRDQMAAFIFRLGVQNAFLQGGNAFGASATLGTLDPQIAAADRGWRTGAHAAARRQLELRFDPEHCGRTP